VKFDRQICQIPIVRPLALSAGARPVTDHIVCEARERLDAWRRLPFPDAIRPSPLWETHTKTVLAPVIAGLDTAGAVIAAATSRDVTTHPTPTDHHVFEQVLVAQLEWLERVGAPLSSFPLHVQESGFAAASVATMVENRRVSSAFLYHLGIAARIRSHVGPCQRIFELGSGYGGLARVLKLLHPEARLVLCDLPDTLYLCWIFLRSHFPNARFETVTDLEAATASEADFLLVPAQAVACLSGLSFDVAINTASLSEMTRAACDHYIDLIENRLRVAYFVHINRFGSPENYERVCATSYALDPYWEAVSWSWRDSANIMRVHPAWPPMLDVVLRRMPEAIRSDDLVASLADSHRRLAAAARVGSNDWHQGMWNAIRIGRSDADIRTYAEALRRMGWREAEHYEAMLAQR
jgi:hypothetical protein